MAVFELVVAMLFAGAILSSWARRIHAPYPALLALAGAALTLLPRAPSVTLDPRLALVLLVSPVLLDSAYDASPRDLRWNWAAVTGLALAAVGVTIVAAAVAARWVVPSLSWAAAIALGAIVAPPDAAAASAVLRQVRPPHRVLVIVEGESLFNDASALLVYRLAVSAVVTGSFSLWRAVPTLAVVTLGSVLLGVALARLSPFLMRRVADVPTSVIFQFLSTFAVWMLADALGLSGIITLVVFAILVARGAPRIIPARVRIPSYAVWDVAVFVLNVLAFILVGLQLRPILDRLNPHQLATYAAAGAAVCGAAILARIVWVMGYVAIAVRLRGRVGEGPPPPSPGRVLRSAAIVAWCGMRGIVTLAAALALPAAFPQRDLILFAAYSVVLGTLVLQGGTLAPLLRLLRVGDDGTVDDEVRRARVETARAALAQMGEGDPHELAGFLRRKYEAHLHRHEAEHRAPRAADERDLRDGIREYRDALRRAQVAERQTLIELRAHGVIGDDAFHRVEEELDWAEINAERMDHPGS